MMEERGMDVLGEGEVPYGKYKGIYAGVNERDKARKGVAIAMRNDWWRCVKGRGSIRARIVLARLKLRREYWVFICTYPPVVGANERKKEAFGEILSEYEKSC